MWCFDVDLPIILPTSGAHSEQVYAVGWFCSYGAVKICASRSVDPTHGTTGDVFGGVSFEKWPKGVDVT